MRSQKWKAVIIKDPKLRRIRTSLRVILREAIHTKLIHLGKLKELYGNKKKLTPSQENREIMLIK